MARKILLADDSVTAQSMGRRILTDAGYEVVTVSNGSAALKKIAESKPDLIVLDVYMPGYGGLEVCQRLKETRETARIPVLLSVGKLEPFKPEEARRVRADAYIVKPFEASELLTALTKLEDKIVPQPEPYKPGRFAKAIAAVEQFTAPESGQRDQSFGDSETGWKDRLIIPHPAPKAPDPETEAPHAAHTGFRNFSREEDFKPAEAKAGFERPIPAGLPTDISAEEIAAITAAAAAVSGKSEEPTPQESTPVAEAVAEPPAAAIEGKKSEPAASVAEEPNAETAVDATPGDAPAATFASAPEAQAEAAPETSSQTTPETMPASEPSPVPETVVSSEAAPASESLTPAEIPAAMPGSESTSVPESGAPEVAKPAATDAEVLAALASLAPVDGYEIASVGKNGETLPVTAAAAVASAEFAVMGTGITGPRWMAEPIPVDEQESTFLLEQEMEKAYAAFAAADAAGMSLVTRPVDTAAMSAAEITPAAEQAQPASAITEFSCAAEPTPEQATPPPATAAEPAASSQLEPALVEVATVASQYSSPAEAATPAMAMASNDTAATAPNEAIAFAAAASASAGFVEATPAPPTASQPMPSGDSSENSAGELEGGARQREAELAAAWANWRHIRESVAGAEAAAQVADAEAGFNDVRKDEPPPAEPEPEAAPAAASAPHDAGEIASIVDNMLAELKPKLMEEIAKKLGKEKKKKE